MKKIMALALAVMLAASCLLMAGCSSDKIIVQTNAYFAPFEYYDGAKSLVLTLKL